MNFKRENSYKLNANESIFPISVYANEDVKIEKIAFEELEELTKISNSLDLIYERASELFYDHPYIEEIVITPDFHKGAGVPIGTTMKTNYCCFPQLIGKDIGCGMTLFVINDISREEILKNISVLQKTLRAIFFQGKRNIPMNKVQRENFLSVGVRGLFVHPAYKTLDGIWKYINKHQQEIYDVMFPQINGRCSSEFNQYCGSETFTYDSQIGSVGGGNHFVEIQYVKKVANSNKINKDSILIMVHSGSLSLGATASQHIDSILKKLYPAKLKHPALDLYPLSDKTNEEFCDVFNLLANANNFASVNRLMLGLMVVDALTQTIREINDLKIIYDSPHNIIHESGTNEYLHRKGACSACKGEPVIIPGSMGSSSFLMKGLGNEEALKSSCHGAGRALSRGSSMKSFDNEFEQFLKNFIVVSPVDFSSLRGDIKKKKLDELKQEAPFAYKSITPVIQTIQEAKIAEFVAEISPILTIKN